MTTPDNPVPAGFEIAEDQTLSNLWVVYADDFDHTRDRVVVRTPNVAAQWHNTSGQFVLTSTDGHMFRYEDVQWEIVRVQ